MYTFWYPLRNFIPNYAISVLKILDNIKSWSICERMGHYIFRWWNRYCALMHGVYFMQRLYHTCGDIIRGWNIPRWHIEAEMKWLPCSGLGRVPDLWVRVQVRVLVICVSTSTSPSTWLLHESESESEYWLMSTSTRRVLVYDLHSI